MGGDAWFQPDRFINFPWLPEANTVANAPGAITSSYEGCKAAHNWVMEKHRRASDKHCI